MRPFVASATAGASGRDAHQQGSRSIYRLITRATLTSSGPNQPLLGSPLMGPGAQRSSHPRIIFRETRPAPANQIGAEYHQTALSRTLGIPAGPPVQYPRRAGRPRIGPAAQAGQWHPLPAATRRAGP